MKNKKIISFFFRPFSVLLKNPNIKLFFKGALKLNLVDDWEISKILFSVKDETLEEVHLMKVVNHIDSGKIIFNIPAINVNEYTDVLIFPSSDFIIHKGKAVWHKTKYQHFKKIIPLDKNLIKFNEQVLYADKPKKIINISSGFSLCGVHSKVWSHFLIQYLPKIDYIQRIVKITNSDLTIILPQYNDYHIKEILNVFFKSIKGINIIELKEDEVAKCDKLYHVDSTSILSEHTSYISPSDVIIPKFVLSFLKDKLVSNDALFPSLKHKPKTPFRKLFIRRSVSSLSPLSNMRVLENYIEVEKFFLAEGFELIEPHNYSLDEKRILFSEAKFIAGSYSSGFMNIMFCQPNTKVLVFMNFQRIYESYIANLATAFKINLVALTGVDIDPTNIHSSYSISIKKIVDSYKKIV